MSIFSFFLLLSRFHVLDVALASKMVRSGVRAMAKEEVIVKAP